MAVEDDAAGVAMFLLKRIEASWLSRGAAQSRPGRAAGPAADLTLCKDCLFDKSP